MKFCEHCNIAVESTVCPKCNKLTRQIGSEDMCLWGTCDNFQSNLLIAALKEENIPHVVMPVRFFAARALGSHSSKKIYLRYCDFDKVKEMYETMFGNK